MKAQIVSEDDSNFKIEVKQFGEHYVASDGERVAIGTTEDEAFKNVYNMQQVSNDVIEDPKVIQRGPKPVDINPAVTTNSPSWFSGTSWDTSNNNGL
jgi:hypothetical protein